MLDESYFYEYADNGEYCYPKTNILKNKFNILDENKLRDVERSLVMARYFEMERCGVTGDFSLKHLQNIHFYLFQEEMIIASQQASICRYQPMEKLMQKCIHAQ